MIKINLIAEGKRPVATRKAAPKLGLGGGDVGVWLIVAGLVLGLGVFGGWWYMLERKIDRKNEEIASAQREVDELALVIKEVDEYKAKKGELEHKIAVINQLKLNQRGPVQIMDLISRALPELLWLTAAEVNSGNITLVGEAFNTNAVANFLENLDRVPEFTEPILRDTERRGPTYGFSISFAYQPAPAVTPAAPGPAAAEAGQPPAGAAGAR
ncbi:MAG: PilN domain-containing protein [Holophagales bacterium]|nr:MAG: PilN domain-containing protein [Holophagales bacterium]